MYTDEKEIQKIHKARHEQSYTIENELVIGGQSTQFEYRDLCDDKLSMKLPAHFVDLPEELVVRKYPSVSRPKYVIANETGTVAFTYSLLDYPLAPDEVSQCILGFKAAIKRTNPANVFYDMKTIPLGDSKLGYYEYLGYAVDDDIFYIVYVTPIGNEQFLHGTFSCSNRDKEAWQPLVHQMMRTIVDNTKATEESEGT